jgi:hypothetical protein
MVDLAYLERLSIRDVTDLLSLHKGRCATLTAIGLAVIAHGVYGVITMKGITRNGS